MELHAGNTVAVIEAFESALAKSERKAARLRFHAKQLEAMLTKRNTELRALRKRYSAAKREIAEFKNDEAARRRSYSQAL